MKVTYEITDNQLLFDTKDKIVVGKAFAFIKADFADDKRLRWIKTLFNPAPKKGGIVVSLLSQKAVALPGAYLTGKALPALNLRSVTADKMLYQDGRDSVHIMIFEPALANSERAIVIKLNNNEHSNHTVRLNENGLGTLVFRDFSAGQYAAHFDDEIKEERYCEFTVAEYKLVPLVANIITQEISTDGKYKAKIKVESFGTPVNDAVNVELLDGVNRHPLPQSRAVDGEMEVSLKLDGAGPHQIVLQLSSNAAKTANVPIVGSRKHERENTIFSPLSLEVKGSLLPGPNSREVRGIFLNDGAKNDTPISVKSVKNGKIELEILRDFQSLSLVAIDPQHPRTLTNSADMSRHPAAIDPQYKRAEELLHSKDFKNSLALLEECAPGDRVAHPYYEYMKACCHAILGSKSKAMESLRKTVQHGWSDYSYFAADSDLEALRDYEPFILFCNGGTREKSFQQIKAGEVITIEAFAPACIVAIGGFIDNVPWEGWTTAVADEAIHASMQVEPICKPGKPATISWNNLPASCSVYCVVKDKRLITTDTPKSRLASSIKDYVNNMSTELVVGTPTKGMLELYSESVSQYQSASLLDAIAGSGQNFDMPALGASGVNGVGGVAWGSGISPDMLRTRSPGSFGSAGGAGGESPRYGSGLPPGVMAASAMQAMGYGGAQPPSAMPSAPRQFNRMSSPNNPDAIANSGVGGSWNAEAPTGVPPQTKAASRVEIKVFESTLKPEVLFAGAVTVHGGSAILKLDIPDLFADYDVESFVTVGGDWQIATTSFRAEKMEFVELNLPLFSTLHDQSRGLIYYKTVSKDASILLKRNGEIVKLNEEKADDDALKTVSFVALPGDYCVELIERNGAVIDVQRKIVQEPGKLKHRIKSTRLLSKGDSIEISKDAGVEHIELLPDVTSTFDLLVDATADYSHCCCEQTASKIVAACAMYLLSGGDDHSRRDKAESIIIAGIEREQSMWRKGEGLQSYPGQGQSVCPYLSALAARHLYTLTGVKKFAQSEKISARLLTAVEKGLEIADDVTAALKMNWPPVSLKTCDDAYAVMSTDQKERRDEAVKFVRNYVRELQPGGIKVTEGPFGASVFHRQQTAYAAAVLLMSKQPSDLGQALSLADTVTKSFNAAGRLYSTVDSAAAIALLSEMRRIKFGSSGSLKINGLQTESGSKLDAMIEKLEVLEGSVAVQTTRLSEDDWSMLSSKTSLTVKLRGQEGSEQSALKLADSVDLVVTIGGGYQDGDLVWVYLPEALSRVYGGGQLKMFSLDFAGASEIVIPLAATGGTRAADGQIKPQHLAVCLRNMFDEERYGNPGLIPVTVQ